MKNFISKTLDDDKIYIAFSRHEFDWIEIKKNPKYVLQWLGSIGTRIFTLSKYSHIDYVSNLKNDEGYNLMLGSIPGGGLIYRNQHNNNFHALYECKVDDGGNKQLFLDYIESQIGSKYDFLAIVGFLFPKREWDKPNKWFCSEIIAAGFKKIGVEFGEKVSGITPDELYFSLELENIIKRVKKLND